MSPGEKARRKRKNAEKAVIYKAKIAELRAKNARCGNCKHFGHVPVSKQRCCDLDSDYYGYSIRTSDQICDRWSDFR